MMKVLFLCVICVWLVKCDYVRSADSPEANERSLELFNLVNEMRLENEALEFEYSASLQFVAQLKCDDAENVYENLGVTYTTYWGTDFCCPYFSWSGEGPYYGECYSGLNESTYAKGRMKAQETTQYPSTMTEIPARGTFETASDCIDYWTDIAYGYMFDWFTTASIGCAYSSGRCECMVGYAEDTTQREYTCYGYGAVSPNVCDGGVGSGICKGEDDCQCWPDVEECDTQFCNLVCANGGDPDLDCVDCINCDGDWGGNDCTDCELNCPVGEEGDEVCEECVTSENDINDDDDVGNFISFSSFLL